MHIHKYIVISTVKKNFFRLTRLEKTHNYVQSTHIDTHHKCWFPTAFTTLYYVKLFNP